jgi:hypothetical protein
MSRYRVDWQTLQEQVNEFTLVHTVRYRDPLNKKRFAVPFKTREKAQAKMDQLKRDGVKEIEITQDTLRGNIKFKEGLDNKDLAVVKKVISKLDKASDAHAGQRDMLKKAVKEEDDHEVSMARGELEAIADKATQLSSMLQGKTDEGNPLEAWVQSKITKAKDYINSVSDYLMYNPDMKEADLTKGQIKKVHKMADELPKKDFKDRYGKEKGDAVRYATATNIVKKKEGITEIEKTPAQRISDLQTRITDKRDKISGMDIGDPKQKTPIAIAKADLETMKLKLDDLKAKERAARLTSEKEPKKEKDMQQIDEKIKGIQTKSDKSGIPYGILKQVYNRGMAAWKGGHRPGTTPQQWAFARVNSFITKGKSYYTADADLAKKARAAKKGKK